MCVPAFTPRSRAAPFAALVLAGAALAPASARAQAPPRPSDVDLTGRQSFTLGSGARAFGMGGAFLARADDATAASWNPAGLSYLRLPELSLVGNDSAFDLERGGAFSDRFRGTSTVDFAALTWPLRVGRGGAAVQVSFQRVVAFGGSRNLIEDRGPDRAPADSSITVRGGFDVLAFGGGLRLTRTLRLGATLNRWFNGYDQSRVRVIEDDPRPRRDFDYDFRLGGWNANLGAIYSPIEPLNLAAVFKTPFTAKVDFELARTDYGVDPDGSWSPFSTNAHRSDDVRLEFPAALGAGVSWRVRSALTVSADYTRTFWSRATIHNYFEVSFAQNPADPPAPDVFPRVPYPRLNWDSQPDTEQIRFGVEYVVIGQRVKVPLRAGYFLDQQLSALQCSLPWCATSETSLDALPRFNGFTGGTGLILGPLLFDVAYVYEYGTVFESPAARNSVKSHRVVVSLIYRHGSR